MQLDKPLPWMIFFILLKKKPFTNTIYLLLLTGFIHFINLNGFLLYFLTSTSLNNNLFTQNKQGNLIQFEVVRTQICFSYLVQLFVFLSFCLVLLFINKTSVLFFKKEYIILITIIIIS